MVDLDPKCYYAKGYQQGLKDAVKHGHWIIHRTGKHEVVAECSNCHVCGSPQWKCCPVCETKMDLPSITDKTKKALEKIGKEVHGG